MRDPRGELLSNGDAFCSLLSNSPLTGSWQVLLLGHPLFVIHHPGRRGAGSLEQTFVPRSSHPRSSAHRPRVRTRHRNRTLVSELEGDKRKRRASHDRRGGFRFIQFPSIGRRIREGVEHATARPGKATQNDDDDEHGWLEYPSRSRDAGKSLPPFLTAS